MSKYNVMALPVSIHYFARWDQRRLPPMPCVVLQIWALSAFNLEVSGQWRPQGTVNYTQLIHFKYNEPKVYIEFEI